MPHQDHYDRVIDAAIERGVIDLESGEFPMTLATDGEASDGHILAIDGGQVPARMPLLFGHQSTPAIPSLGSITGSKKVPGSPARLRGTARVNLSEAPEGDVLAPVRRGIAQLIHDGDLTGMSIRWSATRAPKPRTSLPKSHPHHVPESETGPKRFGLLFEKWRALEGSVVAVGADPKALIGRSDAATDPVERVFFRALGRSVEADSGTPGEVATALRAVSEAFGTLRSHEAFEETDLLASLVAAAGGGEGDFVPLRFGGDRAIFIPREAWVEITGESLDRFRAACRLLERAETAGPTAPAQPAPPDPHPEPARAPTARTLAETSVEDVVGSLRTALRDASRDLVADVTGRPRR